MNLPDKVTLREVALRDGLQSLECFVSTEEKREIIAAVVTLGGRGAIEEAVSVATTSLDSRQPFGHPCSERCKNRFLDVDGGHNGTKGRRFRHYAPTDLLSLTMPSLI